MKFTVGEIAHILNGKIVGDHSIVINCLSKIEEGKTGSLSFLANPKYYHFLTSTKASAVIVNKGDQFETPYSTTLIIVEDAYLSFAKILELFVHSNQDLEGIHPSSIIDNSCSIGENSFIGANVVIEKDCKIGNKVKIFANCTIGKNVTIEDDTTIHAGTTIHDFSLIGSNCLIQSGVVIGADGFGFAMSQNNSYDKVPQIGNVIIENNVEIGANTTIDRATMGSTIIREGVKLDNLIQIAHNVEIGKHTVIAAQSGIAGSTKIGQNCMIGGQVGIIGHLEIGNHVKIAAQSGISSNLKDHSVVQGSPAYNILDYKKSYVYFRKLPQIIDSISKLQKDFNSLLKK